MKDLYNIIPKEYFVEDLKKNKLGTIKIAVLRELIGNAIIRSNYPDETITFKINNKDVVEVPARKMKSREKLLGLKICREFGVANENVRYNIFNTAKELENPNSILFGESVTVTNASVSLPSRVIYDWAYSLRDVSSVTDILQHNALNEDGTMWDEEKGKNSDKLFQVQYVKPGTFLPHFLVVENVTPELFIHLLITVMRQSRYFAQSTTNSPSNIKNHILGVGFSKFEKPINSYTVSSKWGTEDVTLETVSAHMNEIMESEYGNDNYKTGNELTAIVEKLWKDEEELKKVYEKAKEDCESFLKGIKITK